MIPLSPAHRDHRRTWSDFLYCYPVVSRRSRGLSIGINLNPSKLCNFHCVYCEVDRMRTPRCREVDLSILERELHALLEMARTQAIWSRPPFDAVPKAHRRLNDLAFSGDGEPTTSPKFPEAVDLAIQARKTSPGLKLVLITNSTRLQDPEITESIDQLMENGGEIWAKLDAGSEAHYRSINRSSIPFSQILANLHHASKRWPITIQTMLLDWAGQGPNLGELEAYAACLQTILDAGGQLKTLHLYTVARPTPEREARPLAANRLDEAAHWLQSRLPSLPIEVFYGM